MDYFCTNKYCVFYGAEYYCHCRKSNALKSAAYISMCQVYKLYRQELEKVVKAIDCFKQGKITNES